MRELHYRYWIGIALALLVGALTVKWYDIKDLSQLLSFGLALSSLILAVIAIIQAIVSGSSFSQIVGSIATSAGEVQVAAGQIRETSSLLIQHAAAIPPALGEISQRIDQAMNRPVEAAEPGEEAEAKQDAAKKEDISKKIDSLDLRGVTAGGALALYSCILSDRTKKAIDIRKMFPDDLQTRQYVQGFISAIRACNVGNIDMVEGKFSILDFSLKNTEEIEARIANSKNDYIKKINLSLSRILTWML